MTVDLCLRIRWPHSWRRGLLHDQVKLSPIRAVSLRARVLCDGAFSRGTPRYKRSFFPPPPVRTSRPALRKPPGHLAIGQTAIAPPKVPSTDPHLFPGAVDNRSLRSKQSNANSRRLGTAPGLPPNAFDLARAVTTPSKRTGPRSPEPLPAEFVYAKNWKLPLDWEPLDLSWWP